MKHDGDETIGSLNWRNTYLFRRMADQIPESSGVYVIIAVQRAYGLPMSTKVLYVGKAVNLKRRFFDHVNPRREHNKGLLSLTTNNLLEFWFSMLPENQLDATERALIKTSDPTENIIRYGVINYDKPEI